MDDINIASRTGSGSSSFRRKGKFQSKCAAKKRQGAGLHIREVNKVIGTSASEMPSATTSGENHGAPCVNTADTNRSRNINDFSWREGRRVVDLGYLADQLNDGCCVCGEILNLSSIEKETHYLLASVLHVICSNCDGCTYIHTSKKHSTSDKKQSRIYDVNTKVGLALIHAGIGSSQANAFLTTLNVPWLHHKSLKRREREAGLSVECVTKRLCREAIEKEKQIVNENAASTTANTTSLAVSYDMGWQKRGSGRQYNSLTGHGSVMGVETKQVLDYSTRNKRCQVCESAARQKAEPTPHDCRKNWTNSSKAMESSVCVELFKRSESFGIQYSTLVGDEDSTVLKSIKDNISYEVNKWSDINHVKKGLGNQLYKLKVNHKELTKTTISYFQRMFAYCLVQNKGNAEGVKNTLKMIVPHAYGDHRLCEEWCGYLKDKINYKHNGLPHGKDLSNIETKKVLEDVMTSYALHAEKLAPLGSSQPNESLNRTIASKAPKTLHFGGSESNDFRVAAAVAQRNAGRKYVSDVLRNIDLSPGGFCMSFNQKVDTKTKMKVEQSQTKEGKYRRTELKRNRNKENACKETREGITYKSNIGFEELPESNELIPPPVLRPERHKLNQFEMDQVVYFDLETSSSTNAAEIIQISAKANSSDDCFDKYVLPDGNISSIASKITGLTVRTYAEKALFYNGKKVFAVKLNDALTSFIEWLKSLTCSSRIVLVGHNACVFDYKHLLRALHSCKLFDNFESLVIGFSDTLPAFKELYPDRTKYSQESLYCDIVKLNYTAHNSLEDVLALSTVVSVADMPVCYLVNHSSDVQSLDMLQKYFLSKNSCLQTLCRLYIQAKVVSKSMAEKIAASGLTYEHLKLAFQRDDRDGLMAVLGEMVNGKVRVTKTNNIINSLCDHFGAN